MNKHGRVDMSEYPKIVPIDDACFDLAASVRMAMPDAECYFWPAETPGFDGAAGVMVFEVSIKMDNSDRFQPSLVIGKGLSAMDAWGGAVRICKTERPNYHSDVPRSLREWMQ